MPLIADAVHIWREPDGDYHLEWQASHPDTRVTVEPLGDDAGVTAHYCDETGQRARVTGLPGQKRHYFRLVDQHGNEVTATERRFGLDGAPNFRDYGGYRNTDGQQVKWGYLFRSGQLSKLSDSDVETIASLGLDLICDFRREEEQQNDPSRLPTERTPLIVSLPIDPGSNSAALSQVDLDSFSRQAMYDFMVDINRDFAEDQTAVYSRMFREILAQEDARFLVHCAAGKDRTGFAAALVLLALGVSEEVIMQDYLLTHRYFLPQQELQRIRTKYQMDNLNTDSILPMLEVHEAYLDRALAAIRAEYENPLDYLEQKLGVGTAERKELRRRYLVQP
jgi:protein-tyrosine phosphatase